MKITNCVAYLYWIHLVFKLFTSYYMMYGVFSDSESIDSDDRERVFESFPQKVSPTSFKMFFKAAKSKEIFWDACIKFKSL